MGDKTVTDTPKADREEIPSNTAFTLCVYMEIRATLCPLSSAISWSHEFTSQAVFYFLSPTGEPLVWTDTSHSLEDPGSLHPMPHP